MAPVPFLVQPLLYHPHGYRGNVAAPVTLLWNVLEPLVVLDDCLDGVAVFPCDHEKLATIGLERSKHLIGDFR